MKGEYFYKDVAWQKLVGGASRPFSMPAPTKIFMDTLFKAKPNIRPGHFKQDSSYRNQQLYLSTQTLLWNCFGLVLLI